MNDLQRKAAEVQLGVLKLQHTLLKLQLKSNPNHDENGRFASGGGGGENTGSGRSPGFKATATVLEGSGWKEANPKKTKKGATLFHHPEHSHPGGDPNEKIGYRHAFVVKDNGAWSHRISAGEWGGYTIKNGKGAESLKSYLESRPSRSDWWGPSQAVPIPGIDLGGDVPR